MAAVPAVQAAIRRKSRRLVLCFDGTGNSFQGNSSDTNIVKIYDKLDRDDNDQFHYYQTGIGTYDFGTGSLNRGTIGGMRHNMSMTIDSAFGTTFDSHVMAGYRFVMRYYDAGDKIYLFGFSRGAFTARYLARMINTIGLLSKGNEEMVSFAYQLYQEYELSAPAPKHKHAIDHSHCQTNGHSQGERESDPLIPQPPDNSAPSREQDKLKAFTSTFCRRERVDADGTTSGLGWTGVKIYFLGLFDCVNSVAVLESSAPRPVELRGTAQHVRHAVAVDERRVKFKAALLDMDQKDDKKTDKKSLLEQESHKEVWFPGTHCDVGGGWRAESRAEVDNTTKTWAGWLKQCFSGQRRDPPEDKEHRHEPEPFQMSDVPLAWMIHELQTIGDARPEHALSWSRQLDHFKREFARRGIQQRQALDAPMHDSLALGRGTALLKVLLWKFQEVLPFVPRLELIDNAWRKVRFWPNLGQTRDIPRRALLHRSLYERLSLSERNKLRYTPQNDHGEDGRGKSSGRCLVVDRLARCEEDGSASISTAATADHHTLYQFKS